MTTPANPSRTIAPLGALDPGEFLDLAHDAIIVCDLDDHVIYWNRGAEQMYGWTKEEMLGQPLSPMLRVDLPEPLPQIVSTLIENEYWEGELRQARRDGSPIVVQSRWAIRRDKNGGAIGWLKINTDISKRKAAELSLSELTARLLALQEDERRRLARELHDSAGQLIAAIGMNMSLVERESDALSPRGASALADASELLRELSREIRSMSHLLYPPMLEEAGLASAVRGYVEDYEKRSQMPVTLHIPSDLDRFSPELETAAFRVIQECLTNVHRHASSPDAEISIAVSEGVLRVEVKDHGKGMLPDGERNEGVGLRGMRERLKRLGGTLNVSSSPQGTRVSASLPVGKVGRNSSAA